MSESREALHFLDYWRVIQSRKELVIAIALFIILIGLTVTFMLPKVYLAKTRISLKEAAPEVSAFSRRDGPAEAAYYDPFFLKTQQEIIESQYVLSDVIAALKLQAIVSQAVGQEMTESEVRRWLQSCVKVRPYLDTNILEIEVYMSRPKDQARALARDIANEIVRVYERRIMEDKRQGTTRGVDAIHDAYLRQKEMVATGEQELETLRKQLQVTAAGATMRARGMGSVEAARLQQLEEARITSRSHMLDRAARLEKLKSLKGDELLYSAVYIVGDPALSTLRNRRAETQVNIKNLLESFGDQHPKVLAEKAVLEQVNREIADAVQGAIMAMETDAEIARKEYEAIEKEIEEAKQSDITAEAARYLPFRKKEEELEQQKKIRDALEMRWVQERIEMDLPKTPVKVIDWAELPRPEEFVRPNLVLNLILSIVLGLGAGIGLAFFTEYLDTSIKTVEDIEKFIGAPVLAVIPQRVKAFAEVGLEGAGAEAYRVLRTNIQLSEKRRDGRTFCFTSGGVGEGKSLTVANLGFVAAHMGDRTVIVDSDTRRPRQHKIFGFSNRIGLTAVLMGDAKVDDVIQHTKWPNLDIIPSGRLRTASVGLVDTRRLRQIADELRGRYDWVIFDSPPILGVSDASILASVVDSVLLVIQHRAYPRVVSIRAKSMVENIGGNLLGIVMNNINVARDYYYYYSAYGRYGYGGYGSAARRAADEAEEQEEARKPAEKI